MKKLLVFLFISLACLVPAMAQGKAQPKDHRAMKKEIMEFKMKYLAQEMNLKEDQQKKFFELYNEMWVEKDRLLHETKTLEKSLESGASEADYQNVYKAITQAKEKDAEIEKKYDAKFAEFLSSEQLFKMKVAENQFRKKMHEMRHKKKNKDK